MNTNADTIAAEVAKGLSADFEVELIYCFEKNGVLKNVEDDESVIQSINSKSYEDLKNKGIINQGMLPKMENCFNSLKYGVKRVIIGKPELIRDRDKKHTTLIL